MTDGLRPCPFCGGDDIGIFGAYPYFRDKNAYGWTAMCADCGCAVGFILHEPSMLCAEFATIDEAIAAWNARAERTCRIIEYDESPYPVCSECGAVQPDEFTVYYCWSCGAKVVDV